MEGIGIVDFGGSVEGKRSQQFAGGEVGRGGESRGERNGSPRREEGRG